MYRNQARRNLTRQLKLCGKYTVLFNEQHVASIFENSVVYQLVEKFLIFVDPGG
jgi:hypothetical protein